MGYQLSHLSAPSLAVIMFQIKECKIVLKYVSAYSMYAPIKLFWILNIWAGLQLMISFIID